MSVIVKGMEMPGSCAKCRIKYWTNNDPYCPIITSSLEWNKYSSGEWTGVDKRCPLRPLPEKHGRLISADEAYDRIMEQEGGYYIDMDGVGTGLDECRTIVEAEGD